MVDGTASAPMAPARCRRAPDIEPPELFDPTHRLSHGRHDLVLHVSDVFPSTPPC
ncbi:uncharacterized protein CMC5_022480 [Chondromyces crocatus]|uniref:Uncharacterized protein n=1 Tax=Chondromyces crocatus TaxID=52 RepID=A0A0K1EB54_CHOCO|nr:uncharacterized protein CMC5_022480 [Chondromyces crocatus]